MSHSPTGNSVDPSQDYLNAWMHLAQMIRQGRSFSGHERNCAFLNIRGTQFADISAAASLDHIDDSRAVAVSDWDHDGDLDLWLANRTGPRLRFLRNDLPSDRRQFVAVRLIGDLRQQCNRDAIGARLELHMDGRKLTKTLYAGDGYVSQSSKWIHFGMERDACVQSLTVRWPGMGKVETFTGLVANRRYRIEQGTGKAEVAAPRRGAVDLQPTAATIAPMSDRARLVLLDRPQVPDLTYTDFDGQVGSLSARSQGTLLINLWSATCAPCLNELKEFAAHERALRSSNLSMLALCVDGINATGSSEVTRAASVLERLGFSFEAGMASDNLVETLNNLQEAAVYRRRQLPLPTSFLLDGQRRLAVIYKGVVRPEELLADVDRLHNSQKDLRDLAAPFPGRWSTELFVSNPIAVANIYLEGGYVDDAQEYLERYLKEQGSAPTMANSQQARTRSHRLAAVHQNLASIAYEKGHPETAIHHFEEALTFRPGHVPVVNNLAWLLATIPDASLRDGERAIELATEVCRASGNKEPQFLDTLAAAYAEAGKFVEATETTLKALELAQHQGKQDLAAELRRRLIAYEAHRPVREF